MKLERRGYPENQAASADFINPTRQTFTQLPLGNLKPDPYNRSFHIARPLAGVCFFNELHVARGH